MPRAGQAFDRRVCYRKDTSALSSAKAAAFVPVDQPPRALNATLRAVSAIASQGPQGPSAASVPLATGGTQRRAAGVSTGVTRVGGGAGVLGPLQTANLPTLPVAGCQCPQGHCDPHTGRCTCPPGLSGERCDTCSQQHQVPVPGGPGDHGVHCEGTPSLCPSRSFCSACL